MTRNQIDYLRGLVRMDIRKKEKSLAKVVQKPGQTEADAETFRALLRVNLAFRRELLAELDRESAALRGPF